MKLVKSVVCFGLLVSFVLVGLSTSAVAQGLTDDEAAGLLYMWEEEKLARDVYTVMYEKWGEPIFDTISVSEQVHMDAVKGRLEHYHVTYPATNPPGVFTNGDIQGLYDGFYNEGRFSLLNALQVGVTIEETDMLDLVAELEKTGKKDIIKVYNNLLFGSQKHLGAFNYQLGLLP